MKAAVFLLLFLCGGVSFAIDWAETDVLEAQTAIREGEDVNERDDSGVTPLVLAAGYNSPEVVRLLLADGADPKARNSAGETA